MTFWDRPQQHTVSAPSFINGPRQDSVSDLVSIASLTLGCRGTIRARVTDKSGVLTYVNAKGQGKRFCMNLLDESGEIRAVAFNSVCKLLYDTIEDKKVYYISNTDVKEVKEGYPSSFKNGYEMFFTSGTTVTPCNDSTPNIPMLHFNFVPISRLQEETKGSVVDVIGVCMWADEVKTVTASKTNQELKKRDVRLMDESGSEVFLTLWGEQAETFDGRSNPVVAAKGVRVTDFKGVSLSLIPSGVMHITPDIPECHALSEWYSKDCVHVSGGGGERTGTTELNWKSLAQAKTEVAGQDGPYYYSVKAYVTVMRNTNPLYKACPSRFCNKKLIDLGHGEFRCDRCNLQTTSFKWRPLISVTLADFSGEQSVTCFGEQGEQLTGKPAEELGEMYAVSRDEDTRFEDTLFDVVFRPFVFRLRTKKEFYNGEIIWKTSAISVAPVRCVEHTRKLLRDIAELSEELRNRPPRERLSL